MPNMFPDNWLHFPTPECTKEFERPPFSFRNRCKNENYCCHVLRKLIQAALSCFAVMTAVFPPASQQPLQRVRCFFPFVHQNVASRVSSVYIYKEWSNTQEWESRPLSENVGWGEGHKGTNTPIRLLDGGLFKFPISASWTVWHWKHSRLVGSKKMAPRLIPRSWVLSRKTGLTIWVFHRECFICFSATPHRHC